MTFDSFECAIHAMAPRCAHWEKKRGIENPVASLAEQGIDNTSLIVLASYRLSSRPLYRLWQLGDVGRDPSRLIAGQGLCGDWRRLWHFANNNDTASSDGPVLQLKQAISEKDRSRGCYEKRAADGHEQRE